MSQYKVLHRILSTNSSLFQFGLKETHLCSFCNETKESILHLFWNCATSLTFWFELSEQVHKKCNFIISLSADKVVLGSATSELSDNMLIVLAKYYIYSCRLNFSKPCVQGFIKLLKTTYNIEKMSSSWHRSPAVECRIENKWVKLKKLFTDTGVCD